MRAHKVTDGLTVSFSIHNVDCPADYSEAGGRYTISATGRAEMKNNSGTDQTVKLTLSLSTFSQELEAESEDFDVENGGDVQKAELKLAHNYPLTKGRHILVIRIIAENQGNVVGSYRHRCDFYVEEKSE